MSRIRVGVGPTQDHMEAQDFYLIRFVIEQFAPAPNWTLRLGNKFVGDLESTPPPRAHDTVERKPLVRVPKNPPQSGFRVETRGHNL